MATRGFALSARIATPLLCAALALSACSDDAPTASPTLTSSPTGGIPSPTSTPSTSAPSTTATATATASPSSAPSTAPTGPDPTTTSGTAACAAATAGGPDTTGLSAAAKAKATRLSTAARACDGKALIALAQADRTGLAGDRSAAVTFTATSAQNYVWLATLLALTPTESFDGSIAPKVFSEQFAETEAEWDRVIASGLITRAQATDMRKNDGGYTGPRIGIASDGTWTFFTNGR